MVLDNDALPRLTEFLTQFAQRSGWDQAATDRLALVGEETFSSLAPEETAEDSGRPRRLLVKARAAGNGIELEFVSAAEGENLEDQLTYLEEPADIPDVREISFRLLRHYASSVRHQKYHGVDVVSVEVTKAG